MSFSDSPLESIKAGLTATKMEAPAVPNVAHGLAQCRYKAQLEITSYSEAAAAQEYYELGSVQACEQFLPNLLKQRRGMLERIRSETETAADLELSRGYASICLGESTSIYRATATDVDRRTMLDNTVLLISDEGRPYCHGVKIGSHVVTAQHCINGETRKTVRLINSGAIEKARVVWQGGAQFRSQARLDRNLHRDVALLRLEHASNATVTIEMGTPQPNRRLLIMQINLHKRLASGDQGGSRLDVATTLEDNPSCRVFGVSPEGFLLHACQTELGTSGTAMFQKAANGNLRLVGIHAGPTDRLPRSDLRSCEIALPNYGVSLPLREIRSAMRRR